MWSRSGETSGEPLPQRTTRWWALGFAKAGTALALVYVPITLFGAHYRIVYDSVKGANCLPYSVFVVELGHRTPSRGDYVAFTSQQMEPFYANGTPVVKLVVGVAGDHVRVNAEGVTVNEESWGTLLHLEQGEKLWEMGRRMNDVERDEAVPEGHLWMMGTHPRSYDSRYWGYIKNEQVIGLAIPLW